jgi:hypothetical protein
MAYAYPSVSGGDAAASSSSLAVHSSPGRSHTSGQSRKGSDERFDIVREFKVRPLTPVVRRTSTDDIQVKIEEDENYLSFFQDRIRVEEDYIAGLRRCYSRSKAVDTLHDELVSQGQTGRVLMSSAFRRDEKPTTRRAWDEVRDYTIREIQAREAMVGALREVVVKELVRLKEEQTRIRQGIKDNMKHASEVRGLMPPAKCRPCRLTR